MTNQVLSINNQNYSHVLTIEGLAGTVQANGNWESQGTYTDYNQNNYDIYTSLTSTVLVADQLNFETNVTETVTIFNDPDNDGLGELIYDLSGISGEVTTQADDTALKQTNALFHNIVGLYEIVNMSEAVQASVAYFSFGQANPDGIEHLKNLENNTFGFEDLSGNIGGSDFDFNDGVFKFIFMT